VYLGTAVGFSTTAINWTLPSGGFSTSTHNYGFRETIGTYGSLNGIVGSNSWSTMDLNGDDKADLVVTSIGDGTFGNCFGVGSNPYWKVYLGTAAGFSTTAINWTLPSGGFNTSTHNYGFREPFGNPSTDVGSNGWSTMDINGDNKSDLVVTSIGDGTFGNCFGIGSNPYWKVYLNNSSSSDINETFFSNTKIYPNPTTGLAVLQIMGGTGETGQLEVLDLQGRVVYKKELTILEAQTEEVDISTEPTGVYILRLISTKVLITSRLIKE
jgi:hypothetical protein